MAKKNFVIMGATGQIGHVMSEELLNKGHQVRALGRDQKKLQRLKDKGAETISLAFDNANMLAEAFKGAEGVFCMLPPAQMEMDFSGAMDRMGQAIMKGLEQAKISCVINLSSIGAELPSGTGPIKGLRKQEGRLNNMKNMQILHLRPAFFMENFLWSMQTMKDMGCIMLPMKPDLPIDMISTMDIGRKAAQLMDKGEFKGQMIMDLVGPRTHTLADAAKILGKAIGKPDLKFVTSSPADAEKAMLAMRMSPSAAKEMLEMYQSFNEGKIKPTQQITAENRGMITLEQFGQMLAQQMRQPMMTASR